MREKTTAIFIKGLTTFFLLFLFSGNLSALELKNQLLIEELQTLFKEDNREKIADHIVYPLKRRAPLGDIKDREDFIRYFDEIFDAQFIKSLSDSSIDESWQRVGSRGIMFHSGLLWLSFTGKIIAVNYQSEAAKKRGNSLILEQKKNLHPSIRSYEEPVLEWKTEKFRLRIDRMADNSFRYSSWKAHASTSEEPDLVIEGGEWFPDGSGGNHYYDFKNGQYTYRCYVYLLGHEDMVPGELIIFKNGKEILFAEIVEQLTP